MKSSDREFRQNSYKEISDEQLIQMLRDGDEEITDYIMEKYKPLVRKKSNQMYLIGGENEDLIQEGMIGLFKAVRDYLPNRESTFYHFAELCITRQLYSAVEASNRKKHIPLNTYISFNSEDKGNGISLEEMLGDGEADNPEQLVIAYENLRDFQEELNRKLSKMERQVLDLHMEGLNYLEIAERLEKSGKSIDNALQRIRMKIRTLDNSYA